jgi:polyhydroxybutyrate depolymerase
MAGSQTRHFWLKILLALLVAILLLFTMAFAISRQGNRRLISAGLRRRYILHVPATHDPDQPVPLVLSLHGFADWPKRHMRMTGWNELADEEGFIVAYPMGWGFPLRWLAHVTVGEAGAPNPDLVFIRDLIQRLQEEYNIDPRQVYINGFSNGAGMSHLAACQLGDGIAALGGVGGAYLFPWEECRRETPIPAILFHGTLDEIVPYAGGASRRNELLFPAIPDFAAAWAARNGCDPTPKDLPTTNPVNGLRYANCRDDADVVLYTIEGGGHAWPGGLRLPRWIVGETVMEINATRVMWAFFQKFAPD